MEPTYWKQINEKVLSDQTVSAPQKSYTCFLLTKFVLKAQHKDTAPILMLEGICTQLALARNVHTRKD